MVTSFLVSISHFGNRALFEFVRNNDVPIDAITNDVTIKIPH